MFIKNDVVTFESSDIDQFSDALKRALATAAGENRSPEELLSQAVTREILAAAMSHKNSVLASLESVAEGLAKATDGDRAAADAKLAEVRAVLGVDQAEAVAEEAKPGLIARLFGFGS